MSDSSSRPAWDRYEIAWAAGYFDGEGSVGFYGGKGDGLNGSVRLVIGNTQIEELQRFKRAVMDLGRITGPRISLNRKPMWWWQVQNFSGTLAVTALLWKYLSTNKRTDCQSAWAKDREYRLSIASALFCKKGHSEENRIVIQGRPRCKICLSSHLTK